MQDVVLDIPAQLRADIAQRLLYLDGHPFSLDDYPFYVPIYNGEYQGLLLKCGRQVGKSVSLCNFTIAESIGIPHFRTLYVAPSQEQTQRFSNTRLAKTVHYSPLVQRHFISSEFSDRTMLRMFKNGAEVALSYACDNPDRARGISADRLCFDEIQDILYEPVVPVLNECFDAQTEVLTREGWANVSTITKNDYLADVDPDGVIHWHRPTQVIRKTYTGRMYTFRHKGFALRVTRDHVMWADLKGETRRGGGENFEFITAENLARGSGESFRLTGPTGVKGFEAAATREFPGIPRAHGENRRGITVPYPAFARLVGWYLAKGSIKWAYKKGRRTCPRPCITQSAGRYLDDILSAIEACGLSYRVDPNSKKPHTKHVVINSRVLGEYFLPLGKSPDKFIPEEFFDNPGLLRTLLEALYLGDGSGPRGSSWDRWELFTVSRRLAESTHRAWTLLGRSPCVTPRTKPTKSGYTGYGVRACKKNFAIFYRRDGDKHIHTEMVKDEDVYCFTVPFHRPVMRGGPGQRPIVTSQCMANSEWGYETYAGTPKTLENTIEHLWQLSTRTEWIMKCSGCGSWNFIEGVKSIGTHGVVCIKCDHPINTREGMWYDFNPGAALKGFHISQPMLPRNYEDPKRWQRLLTKIDRYSETKLKNEVFGISDALGARIIGKGDLEALCQDYDIYRQPPHTFRSQFKMTVGGVDWSGGGVGGFSRTVVWIFGITKDNRLQTLYFRIYPITSPVTIVDDVADVFTNYGVQLVVGDRGEGHLANDLLSQKIGQHRVQQLHYGNQAKPLTWKEQGGFYTADRTTLMDNYFMVLRRGGVVYPRLQHMREPIQDVLNIYEEVTQQGKKVWRHAPTQPDDSFHAQLFAWIAAKILLMDLQFNG